MLVEELVSAITNANNGEYSLTAEDTTEWPLGILVMDIEYTDTLGFIHSTETFEIDVLKDVTYD